MHCNVNILLPRLPNVIEFGYTFKYNIILPYNNNDYIMNCVVTGVFTLV